MYVLDSNVFASIIVKDEFYARALRFLRENFNRRLVTVDFAFVEVANTLWKHVHVLRRIPEDKYRVLRRSIRPLISSAVSSIYDAVGLLETAIDNALNFDITVYDSLYVTLALDKRCKLVSFDEELRRRLKKHGVNLLVSP